ncbi:MAG: exodeoxyribonuclease VII small subunit [Oscillospiraceae bacterium]
MDFEQAMKRLTEISEQMNGAELPLEESMKLYTEAVGLVKFCKEYIAGAKLTVEKLEAE